MDTVRVNVRESIVKVGGDYNILENKPRINGVLVSGNKTSDEYGIPTDVYDKGEVNELLAGKVSEPENEGTAGQVLTTDGEGGRSWTTVQGGGGSVAWDDITDKPEEFPPEAHTHEVADITDFPTGVSAFDNDAGYLTEHQDISGKISEPAIDGTNGQVLATNGAGGRYWRTVSGGGGESGVQDVVVNGASVVSEGIATIQKAQINAGSGPLGVVGVKALGYSTGLTIDDDGYLKMYGASDAQITARSNAFYAFNPSQIDKIVKSALADGVGAAYSDSEKNAARSRIGASSASDVSGIQALIPSQATSVNQLADRNFVNSSVATNTAYFKGTYDIVEDLGLTHGASESSVAAALATVITDVTNNDYCFVEDEDGAGTTVYRRYKYSTEDETPAWSHEFDLNNSSFTSDQWASINSGVTAADVTKVGNISHETWTFTLDDDTEVEKEVCVWVGNQ